MTEIVYTAPAGLAYVRQARLGYAVIDAASGETHHFDHSLSTAESVCDSLDFSRSHKPMPETDLGVFTDLINHHIEGFVPHAQRRGMNPNLRVPLISRVANNFYQGGCIDGVALPEGFTRVLSLYKWEQYKLPEGCERRTVTMYDARDEPDLGEIVDLVGLVCNWLDGGHQVLVHCQAGLNRSGLLAAAVLIVRENMSPDDAIRWLRNTRCELVLCNETFENWIRERTAEQLTEPGT